MKKLATAFQLIILFAIPSFIFAQNDNIVITEISYNPPESGSDSTEFIELYNAGSTTIDLDGYNFTQGVTHTFSSYMLSPGEYFVVAVDSVAIGNVYGSNADAQWAGGGLSNSGEDIILKDKNYIKYFGQKFEGEELKSAPRGFDKEHPDIDLLRKKGFIAVRNFTDAEVLSAGFLSELDKSYKALRPFFNVFSDVLTTNLNGESIL